MNSDSGAMPGEEEQDTQAVGSENDTTLARDVAERKAREAERRYILKSARCLLWSSEITLQENGQLDWKMLYFDEEAAQRLVPIDAPSGDTYIWKWHAVRLPEDRKENYRIGDAQVRAGQDFQVEFRMQDREGNLHWIREDVHVETLEAGSHWRAVGVCTDITEQKRHQAEIELLNERLRRAMSETHHRIKNNLQIISAMLDMQHMQYTQSVPMTELDRVRNHIQALSAIHDLLTRQARTDHENNELSVLAAIRQLMPLLQSMVEGSRKLTFTIEDLRISIRQSTTLAVLVNELVSNAFKHGQGEIRVTFAVHGENAELGVEDEGRGFPAGFDGATTSSTGMELVQSLARWDLNGQVHFENRPEGGARVRVVFPVPGVALAARTS